MIELSHVLQTLLSHFEGVRNFAQFMQQGGTVLWCLFAVVVLFWMLVVERMIYLFVHYPKHKSEWLAQWARRGDHHSWHSRAIRDGWLAQARINLFQHTNTIKLLVSLCPMLGLLGTVTGMIAVFDVMALQGNSEPKQMAAGIAMATLPTMAGMVAALVGMFVHARLVKLCRNYSYSLEQQLRSQQ